jgi:phenylacetate-coenzyme A ligase PaaK-like adenylate-forming protein
LPSSPARDALLDAPAYSLGGGEKERLLAAELSRLTAWHREACPPYARVLDALFPEAHAAEGLSDQPWLPVSLFKTHELRSVPEDEVFKVLTSSGTTGQAVSRIVLDRDATAVQTRTLARVMTRLLGPERRPMLVIDARATVADRRSFSARAAGIRGMTTFGRAPVFALRDDMTLDRDAVAAFAAEHRDAPVLLFGFTFMVWRHFVQELAAGELDLPGAVLVHSGGWKKLQDEAVDDARFKHALAELAGIRQVSNFYGMVEQIGTVFLECEHGHLHAPDAADVLIRDPRTWEPLGPGEQGVVQVVSALPTSYPGHSLMTEDLGVVTQRDGCACGRRGATIALRGRIPKAELRGCGDTHARELEAA